jgi:hypothetical protein
VTRETTPRIQRVYLRLEDAGHGMMRLAASLTPPAYDEPVLVLLSRGVMPLGQPISLLLVSDPSQNDSLRGKPGADGQDGASAYQLAQQQGYGGTQAAWLASLIGAAGASAYELARAAGYGGTMTQWLASLVGAAGLSAYDVAHAAGFVGTQSQWLASLKGKDASSYLGTVTIGQTATVVIQAGIRRLVLTIPASLGVAAGDSLYLAPMAAFAGYALHDVVAVSATSLNIGLTTPLLAVGASFAIPSKLFRLNT